MEWRCCGGSVQENPWDDAQASSRGFSSATAALAVEAVAVAAAVPAAVEAVAAVARVVEWKCSCSGEEVRGECPLAFVILRGAGTSEKTPEQLESMKREINDKVRADVGAFARLIGVIFMEKLPKTRSGKILRGTIRKIAN